MVFLVTAESYLALPAAWRGLGEALEGPHGKETSGTHSWLPKLQPLISGEGGPVHGVPPGGTEPGSGGGGLHSAYPSPQEAAATRSCRL